MMNRLCAGTLPIVGILFAALFQSLEVRAAEDAARLRIPGFTAYVTPDPHGARISRDGVSHWTNPEQKIVWGGETRTSGWLQAGLVMKLPAGETSRLRLSAGGQARETTVTGGTDTVLANFGRFEISQAGPLIFTLESLNDKGRSAGIIDALLLAGPAVANAHFNLKERRNCASVHLSYEKPGGHVNAFYAEATAVEDPLATFYMATGWSRGYFGMQVNSPTERRIIFSVWDAGHEPVDRNKVADENRTKLVAKGDGVFAGDFGHEGTGGHSHLVYPWKTGSKQRFLVTAEVTTNQHTIYSGYWFHPEKNEWTLISSWEAPKDGHWLGGLHSFSEGFGGDNGNLMRKARFGNQWARTNDGQWHEIVKAGFSHDETGGRDRMDRFMGVENGEFFLCSGGFVAGGDMKYGTPFTREPVGKIPADLPGFKELR